MGRRLNNEELAAYGHIPRALAQRVRVIEIPALPGQYVGVTLGRHILLAEAVSDRGDSALLAHELVHVRQWKEQGPWRFAFAYSSSFVKALVRTRSWQQSYNQIPAEVEARQEATRWATSHQSQ